MCGRCVLTSGSLSLLSVCLSLSFSLNPSGHVDDQVLEREKTEQCSLLFPFFKWALSSPSVVFSFSVSVVLHLFLPVMKLLTRAHTHPHIVTGTAVQPLLWSPKSTVLYNAPLNNYFYDLLPNDSYWLHNQAKRTHLDIYTHTHTTVSMASNQQTPTQRKGEMEPIIYSSGLSLPAKLIIQH